MTPEGFVSIGTRLDLLIAGWLGVPLLIASVALLVLFGEDLFDYAFGLPLIFGAVVGAVATTVWLICLVPFDTTYHRVYQVEATVESVSNTFESGSGDVTYAPVVTLSGIDRPVVIDDPRITQLNGADLTLTCQIEWHYRAADTYSCAIAAIN